LPDSNRRIKISCRQVADIELPREVERLYDLAYNLWWSWTPRARQLFSSIKVDSWARYRNPVDLLLNVDRHHWEQLISSDAFMGSYSRLMQDFDRYLNGGSDTWFERHYPDHDGGPVAYFSMEYGLDRSLAIYSGGLGVLSGDHCKSASDLGLPFVGVGLLYRSGYFNQAIDADGIQQHIYPDYDFNRLPVRPAMDERGRDVVVGIPLPGREVQAKVWVAEVGRVSILLLDTDLPANDPADRPIAKVLYVRGREMRLVQEMILGVGGVKALAALGIEPALWHINEGHSVLLQLERMRTAIVAEGVDFETALERVGENVAFTTHTPVPAGNEQFDPDLATSYLDPWSEPLGTSSERLLQVGNPDHGEPDQPFNLTAFALRTSSFANGVSRLNAEVADRMWRHLFADPPAEEPVVQPITNGIHLPTWLGTELQNLFAVQLGPDWQERLLDPKAWEFVYQLANEDLWAAHRSQKERLMRFSRSRLLEQYARHGRPPSKLREVAAFFSDEALTIGFARRFATYKRAGLLFSDLHRLRGIVRSTERPVCILLAGKAHPADRPAQELIQHLFMLSQEADLEGRVAFIENYNMRVGRMLVQGVDVWLNTPRRPFEASGTSGQKAAVNGVLNCSILDGWWPEGFDGENGWSIGAGETAAEEWQQDQHDANSLYSILEEQILPTYYERDQQGLPVRWIEMMKRSIASIGARFSASRMVREYTDRAYMPLARAKVSPERD